MKPAEIFIKDFTYNLPDDRIAHYPLPQRDQSKLLIYKQGTITEDIYKNISDHLPKNSLLIFNNTKVIEARLLFEKLTGGVIEIFCLEPHQQYPDITTAMSQKEKVLWKCLIGGASKWKHGQVLEKKIRYDEKELKLSASYKEKGIGDFVIEFSWSPEEMSFAEVLHKTGAIPLPPYIKRKAEESDAIRYQTIYAFHDGSVAAPTAGLHFTDAIFKKLDAKNIRRDFVTLHVGAGTFKPVKSETIDQHEMHAEHIDVSSATIQHIIQHIDNIIAVGTTSLRTLESLYWLGVKVAMNKEQRTKNTSQDVKENLFELSQWEIYNINEDLSSIDALQTLLNWIQENKMERIITKTSIIIVPGYKFRIVKGLVTNFHQPQSTLLLLVAALIGDNWKKIYEYALQNDFRFLSYGDGCLLWPDQQITL